MAAPPPIPRTSPPDPGPLGPPPPLFERPPAAPPLFFGGLVLLLVLGLVALLWPSSTPPLPTDDELASLVAQAEGGAPPPPSPVRSVGGGALGAGFASGGPSFAELRLTVDGSDAVVWIDDERAGPTPLRVDAVPAGPRAVRVMRGAATLMDTVLYIRSGALVHFHVVEPSGGSGLAGAQDSSRPAARAPAASARRQPPRPRQVPQDQRQQRPRVGW